MLAKVLSGALNGLEGIPVTVEVDIASQGLPSFTIVGLANKAVEESKERVRAAIKNSGADFPAKRITVNLAPADLPKEGSLYDLPIALGILLASQQIEADLTQSLIIGELGLDGTTRGVPGTLSLALLVKKENLKNIFVPSENALEASLVSEIDIFPVKTLLSLLAHFLNTETLSPYQRTIEVAPTEERKYDIDLEDIKGQEQGKRALEIASAGAHNLLLYGPPGVGKTMLAKSLPSIMPSLTDQEALEITKIYSIWGGLKNSSNLIKERPFRSPHHTSSYVGLIGGGVNPKPGEISLAHRGVLFLDEFPEFPRQVLESLRSPLEDGNVTISRSAGRVVFPAKFSLIASANPCQCGYYGSNVKECLCSPSQIQKYKKKLSGPILDRIDLFVEVPRVEVEKLAGNQVVENSQKVRERVEKARNRQLERYQGLNIKSNGELGVKEVKKFCPLSSETVTLLTQAAHKLNLSARAYTKTIKIARTIADLEGSLEIKTPHLAEALQYRLKEN